jgi:hypothetical protein
MIWRVAGAAFPSRQKALTRLSAGKFVCGTRRNRKLGTFVGHNVRKNSQQGFL